MNKSERKSAKKTLLEAMESNNIPVVQDMLNKLGQVVCNDHKGHYLWFIRALAQILEFLPVEFHRCGNGKLVYEIRDREFKLRPAVKEVFDFYVEIFRSDATRVNPESRFWTLLWEFDTVEDNDLWKHWFLNACHYKWQCEIISDDPQNYWW